MRFDKRKLPQLALVLVGNVIYALSCKLFLISSGLMSCGTTGLALIANNLAGIPLPTFIFIFNLLMLLLGLWVLGKQFALTTVFSSLFYPIALSVLDAVLGDIHVTEDIFLNLIFAGLGLGVSLGMVIRGGASTGGMDIPPLILKKLFNIPISASLWCFDFCILLAQAMYHPFEDLLYGILLVILLSFSLNKVLLFGTSRTEVKLVSEKSNEIRDAILSQVDRGVTILHGEGGYLQRQTEIILSVVSNHELPKIEQLARSIDPSCFMIVSSVTEVWGRGFTYSKKYDMKRDNSQEIH